MRALGLFFIVPAFASVLFAGENWPEFRGPTGDGHSDSTGLPTRWGENENVRWKTPIHGKGWSSPVVWGNQVWLTTARADGKEMFVLCVDRETGKIVHDLKLFDVEKPGFSPPFNSYASPTPVVEEGRVYAHFGSYGTVCLDTATAKIIWSRRDLPCDHWRAPGSSPILFHGKLYAIYDGYDYQYVVALDARTGKTVWKRDRDIRYGTDNGDYKKGFCTPAIVPMGGRHLVVCPSAVATIAHDSETGDEVWKVYHGGMNASARPLVGFGKVFISTGDLADFKLFSVGYDARGEIPPSQINWKTSKGVPNRASLLLIDDLLYMANDGGVISCVEAKTGKPVWQERVGGEFTASPVYGDGKMYFFDMAGAGHVLRPGRSFQSLAVNHLDDGCLASPAIAGKALFVRTKTHLYRIDK